MTENIILINEHSVKLIPYGYCGCGCGRKTLRRQRTNNKLNQLKGEYNKYLRSHRNHNGSNNSRWKGGRKITPQNYVMIYFPGHPRASKSYVYEHILVVEKIIGKYLPKKAEVHHIDNNRTNNTPSNLILCQNKSYHNLLHLRERALKECGNPSWRMCRKCKEWDALENLHCHVVSTGKHQLIYYHRKCLK